MLNREFIENSIIGLISGALVEFNVPEEDYYDPAVQSYILNFLFHPISSTKFDNKGSVDITLLGQVFTGSLSPEEHKILWAKAVEAVPFTKLYMFSPQLPNLGTNNIKPELAVLLRAKALKTKENLDLEANILNNLRVSLLREQDEKLDDLDDVFLEEEEEFPRE